MKKILLLASIILAIGCGPHISDSDKANIWIKKAKCPIKVELGHSTCCGERYYTLIDANGAIYETGATTMALPHSIVCKSKGR